MKCNIHTSYTKPLFITNNPHGAILFSNNNNSIEKCSICKINKKKSFIYKQDNLVLNFTNSFH